MQKRDLFINFRRLQQKAGGRLKHSRFSFLLRAKRAGTVFKYMTREAGINARRKAGERQGVLGCRLADFFAMGYR